MTQEAREALRLIEHIPDELSKSTIVIMEPDMKRAFGDHGSAQKLTWRVYCKTKKSEDPPFGDFMAIVNFMDEQNHPFSYIAKSMKKLRNFHMHRAEVVRNGRVGVLFKNCFKTILSYSESKCYDSSMESFFSNVVSDIKIICGTILKDHSHMHCPLCRTLVIDPPPVLLKAAELFKIKMIGEGYDPYDIDVAVGLFIGTCTVLPPLPPLHPPPLQESSAASPVKPKSSKN